MESVVKDTVQDGLALVPSTELIEITQLPVIKERLKLAKPWIQSILADIADMECTEDNVKEVKKRLSEVRKVYGEFEAKRKEIKAEIEKPYTEVEAAYKENVTSVFDQAIETLKAKIDSIEDGQKSLCYNVCLEYFDQLAASYGLDFVKYPDMGQKISLTEAKKKAPSKHFDEIYKYLTRLSEEMSTISAMSDSAEIAAEYKTNGYNFSKAVVAVRNRKEAAEAEKKRLEEYQAAKQAEAERVAKVEKAAAENAPIAAPTEVKQEVEAKKKFFYMWVTLEQWEAIKPALKALKAECDRLGIKLG